MEANSRISVHKKEGPEPSPYKVDRLYAWHQPVVDHLVFSCVDHNSNKDVKALNLKASGHFNGLTLS